MTDSGMDMNKGERMSIDEFKRIVWGDLQVVTVIVAIEAVAIIVLIIEVFGV